jgi:hypothetical protein
MTEAIDDCTEAINLDGSYLKAYLKRAKWYVKIVVEIYPLLFFR